MDDHTLEKVEFDRVRELLANQANCSLGRSMAVKVQPVHRRDLIATWLAQLEEMTAAGATVGFPPFGGVTDVRAEIRAAVPPNLLEPEDFARIADTLDGTHAITQWAQSLPADLTHLHELCGQLGDFKAIADAIHRVVDGSGQVRDDASAKLRKIRIQIADAKINIGHVVDRILREKNVSKWLRYPDATFHQDRLVLPLAAEHRGRIQGIVHRSSDSGATLFVEPAEAVELNNLISTLRNEEEAEIGRLLWHLTQQLHLNRSEISKTLNTLAILDLIVAKVRFATSYQLTCPKLSDKGHLHLRQARHLLLVEMQKEAEQHGQRREVVPINVRLGDDFDVLIITGPNTGGKTVALKTVALCCAMAQAGLPIPAADGSWIPLYRDVLVDIGDEQSLQQSLSTFSSHLTRLLTILRKARPDVLMLVDELGAGTDPEEGAALGQAIVSQLLEKRCPSLITTHLGVLKSLAYTEARAENGCVDFDEETLKPTYRLLIGEPGNSNAINIAARLGLPQQVIEKARKNLSGAHEQLSRAIKGTLHSRRMAELARDQSEAARAEADKKRAEAERQKQQLELEQAQFQAWIQMISSLKRNDRVHIRRFDREGVIVRMNLQKQTAIVSVGAMEMEVPLREISKPVEAESSS